MCYYPSVLDAKVKPLLDYSWLAKGVPWPCPKRACLHAHAVCDGPGIPREHPCAFMFGFSLLGKMYTKLAHDKLKFSSRSSGQWLGHACPAKEDASAMSLRRA